MSSYAADLTGSKTDPAISGCRLQISEQPVLASGTAPRRKTRRVCVRLLGRGLRYRRFK